VAGVGPLEPVRRSGGLPAELAPGRGAGVSEGAPRGTKFLGCRNAEGSARWGSGVRAGASGCLAAPPASCGASTSFSSPGDDLVLKRWSNNPMGTLVVFRGDPQNFLQRRNALSGFVNPDHAQSLHSFTHRLVLDDRGGGALNDQTPNGFRDGEDLDNGGPADVATPLAPVATGSVIERSALVLNIEFAQ